MYDCRIHYTYVHHFISRAQDASFVSFLSMCLKWEPEVRLTPQQALQHPWLLPGDAKEGGGNEKKKKKGH